MPNYVVLLYHDPERTITDPAEREREFATYGALTEEWRANGAFVDGAPVENGAEAARLIRVSGGKTDVMVGQLPSRKEHLVGYYRLAFASTDEAAREVARIPAAAKGFIELIPEMAM